jgi:hypothetical protein
MSPTINIKRNCTIEGERLVRSMSCKYLFLKEPMVLNFIYFINVIEASGKGFLLCPNKAVIEYLVAKGL